MAVPVWRDLIGQTVAGRYEVAGVLTSSNTGARLTVTSARWRGVMTLDSTGKRTSVDLSSFQHPNLVNVLDWGEAELEDRKCWYTVVSEPQTTLAELIVKDPLSLEQVTELCRQLLFALDYLRERDLACCNITAETVGLFDGTWKLLDLSAVQSTSMVDTRQTRPLLGASPFVPPDAFHGRISPAWDMWSLGVLLNQALNPRPATAQKSEWGAGRSKPVPLPAPFDMVVALCMQFDPEERATPARVRELIGIPSPVPEFVATDVPSLAEAVQQPPVAAKPAEEVPVARSGVRTYRPSDAVASKTRSYRVPAPAPTHAHKKLDRVAEAPVEQTLSAAAEPAEFQSWRTPDDRRSEPRPSERKWKWAGVGVVAALTLFGAVAWWIPHDSPKLTAANQQPAVTAAPAAPSAPTAPPAAVSAPTQAADRVRESVPELREQAREVVNQWAETNRKLDLDGHLALYAPRLEVFFKSRDVEFDKVRAEKEQAFKDAFRVDKFRASRINIDSLNSERAVLSFRKDWEIAGKNGTAGAGRHRLILRRMDRQWKIAGELEVQVYFTRRLRS